MDVRAKQRLSFRVVRQTLAGLVAVSPHVISSVGRLRFILTSELRQRNTKFVPFEIIEESSAALSQYEKVSIAFRVETHFLVVPIDNGLGGLTFIEEPVTPYVKDYDAFENERPSAWLKRFDISRWGIFSAFENGQRVGGAAVAWNTPEIEMLEGRKDLACLWDLRVHPDYRNKGIGRKLFSYSLDWARKKQCHRLKIDRIFYFFQ